MKIDYRQLELWQNLPRFYGVNQPQILSPIGPNDSAIAGHALAVGAIMVTHNVREFIRVSGLTIEDWTEDI